MQTIRIAVEPTLLQAADAAAKRENLNKSELVREALRRHLKRLDDRELEARDRAGIWRVRSLRRNIACGKTRRYGRKTESWRRFTLPVPATGQGTTQKGIKPVPRAKRLQRSSFDGGGFSLRVTTMPPIAVNQVQRAVQERQQHTTCRLW